MLYLERRHVHTPSSRSTLCSLYLPQHSLLWTIAWLWSPLWSRSKFREKLNICHALYLRSPMIAVAILLSKISTSFLRCRYSVGYHSDRPETAGGDPITGDTPLACAWGTQEVIMDPEEPLILSDQSLWLWPTHKNTRGKVHVLVHIHILYITVSQCVTVLLVSCVVCMCHGLCVCVYS